MLCDLMPSETCFSKGAIDLVGVHKRPCWDILEKCVGKGSVVSAFGESGYSCLILELWNVK